MSAGMRTRFCMTLFLAGALRAPAAEVSVLTVSAENGLPVTGRLLEFSLEHGLRLEPLDAGSVILIPSADIVFIQFSESERPNRVRSVELRLSNGDRIFARPVDAEGDILQVESPLVGKLSIPLERIDRWFSPGFRPAVAPSRTEVPPAQDDVVQLSNGDSVRGMVLGIDDQEFQVETESGEVRVPHDRIASADLVSEPPPALSGIRAQLRLTDGSRLTTPELMYSTDGFTVVPFGAARATVPAERVARIDISGGRWVWISELATMSGQHTPMLTLDRPVVPDANVLGRPMRIADRSFDRGVGVQTESVMLFDLAGQYREFVTWLGVDDSGGALSDVTAEVRVDGEIVFQREHLRKGELVGPVRINLQGANRIELRALFGGNAGVQDWFNWAGAGLVR